MDGKSLTPQEVKLKQLQELMPEVFSEGKVDFERLKATLGEDINFNNERYVLNWAGKSDAFKALQSPTAKTLIPAKDESVDFDTTENIFIEGENLEVLKVLQKSYFGKVKMIYIDPPYNTGNDSFIYPDKFSETKDEYQKRVGDKDEEGYMTKDGMFKKNSKESGQYHSNWLNMIYPRLFLAKNLLRSDGVIFISIDDNEVQNLRMAMNEIFGEENFIGALIVKSTPNARNYGHMGKMHEYCLMYGKNIDLTMTYEIEVDKEFDYNDDQGGFNTHPLYNSDESFHIDNRANLYYPFFINPDTEDEDGFMKISLEESDDYSIEVYPPLSSKNKVQFVWRWGKEKSLENLNKEIIGYQNGDGEYRIVRKMRHTSRIVRSMLLDKSFSGRRGTSEVEKLFKDKVFSFPKPIELLKTVIKVATKENDIVLDFFSGSGTTAHSIYEVNKEDNGNRKYVCIQLPEQLDYSKKDAKKNKKAIKLCDKLSVSRNIAEIAKERIRLASKKIAAEIIAENKKKKGQLDFEASKEANHIDLGFKVFKLSDSNFKQWQQIEGKDAKALAEQMKLFVDPVSEKATTENMVFELLLKSGKDLNSFIEHKKDYFCINTNEVVLMLEKATKEIANAVLQEKPLKVIALDRLFKGNDQLKTNTALQMKDAGIEFKTI